MFVPDTLEFYPTLIRNGPLKAEVMAIVRAFNQKKTPGYRRLEDLVMAYHLRRQALAEALLRKDGLGWCDMCHVLMPARHVRTVYRHGTGVRYKTDCGYGDQFPVPTVVREVVSLCNLHGEVHEGGSDISMLPVALKRGHLIALVNGIEADVSSCDERQDPDEVSLQRAGLTTEFGTSIPPRLKLSRAFDRFRLVMKDNPYVVIAER